MAEKKTKVAGLILAILSWLVFVGTTPYTTKGQFLALVYPLAFAVAAFVVTGRELAQAAQAGARRGVPMTGRVLSVILGVISGLFLILYVADYLGSHASS